MKKFYFLTIILTAFMFFPTRAQSDIQLRNVLKEGPVIEKTVFEEPEMKEKTKESRRAYFTLVSNINYAPFGVGIIINPSTTKSGYFFQLKFSEDFFFRNYRDNLAASETGIFDVNEFFMTGGSSKYITKEIQFNIGGGVMIGVPLDAGSGTVGKKEGITWVPSPRDASVAPVLSTGISLNLNKTKIILGYEVAFVKPERYPVQLLNNRSFSRLSSFVIGIGI